MKNNVLIWSTILGLPVFSIILVSTIINVLPDNMDYRSLQSWSFLIEFGDYNWWTIAYVALLPTIATALILFGWYILFHERYKRILHKQKITRMIFSNRFYEEETVSKKNKNNKTVSKKKLTYFPRVYYMNKGGFIYIRFATDMSRFQSRFMDLSKDLENGLYCDLVDNQLEENFIIYKLLYDGQINRISIDESVVKDGSLRLMKNTYWEFDELPHMLVTGGTGGGKTYFIFSVIKSALEYGSKIYVSDPKNSDLADLSSVLPRDMVHYSSDGITKMVENFRDEMLKRSEEMKEHPKYKTGENYAYLGYKPVFLVFDEYVAFMDMIGPTESKKVISHIKQIVMLGRQMGFFLILGLQRPDAKYLADGIRDQFNFRVGLGRMSESGYGMLFGDTDKAFTFKSIKGRGYADTGTSVITEFYSPLVPKGYNFIEAIRKAYEVGAGEESAPADGTPDTTEEDLRKERSG